MQTDLDDQGVRKIVLEIKVVGDDRADAICQRLADRGLEIKRRIGNKVFGSVVGSKLADLRDDADVIELEESVPLRR